MRIGAYQMLSKWDDKSQSLFWQKKWKLKETQETSIGNRVWKAQNKFDPNQTDDDDSQKLNQNEILQSVNGIHLYRQYLSNKTITKQANHQEDYFFRGRSKMANYCVGYIAHAANIT